MEKKSNKIYVLVVMGIISVLIVTLGLTYAYWRLTKWQENENVVTTGCLNLTFEDEQNDIYLPKAYPISDEEGVKLTPYSFKLTNHCNQSSDYELGLEMLDNTNLDSKYIRYYLSKTVDEYILHTIFEFDDSYRYEVLPYNTLEECNIAKENALAENRVIINGCTNDLFLIDDIYSTFTNKGDLLNTKPFEDELILENAIEGRLLNRGTIDPLGSIEFKFGLWMDYDADLEARNKTMTSKIVVNAVNSQKNVIRDLNTYTEAKGLWKYREDLTSIVIEDNIHQIDGDKVYGPFDESSEKDSSVMSYVKENDDGTFIGYLQGNGKIILNANSKTFFSPFENVTKIDGLNNLDTSRVKDMSGMFAGMISLKELDLSNFDTRNVTNMSNMFNNSGLTKLTLGSNFDTSNVTDMSYMFSYMRDLQTLDLGNLFDTSKVTNMEGMFGNLKTLQNLDLKDKFDTSNVTNMSYMFSGISTIKTLDLGNLFNTSKVTNMEGMFSNLNALQNLDLKDKFDTSNVTNMSYMFYYLINLQTLNLRNLFDTSKVTDMNCLFYGLVSLRNLDLGNLFDTSNVTNMSAMFANLGSLQSLDLKDKFNTSKVSDMSYMFAFMGNLKSINYGNNFIHKSGANIEMMFNECTAPPPDVSVHSSWSGVSFS